MRTHNGLLVSLPGADGMKTGFICDSGYNVVASATRDGRRLVAVVLGEQSMSNAPRARDRSLGERLQALFLEVAVRHQHRWAGDPTSLVDRWAAAFEGRHLRRRQTEAVRYAQGQSQGRLEEAQHCQHRRQLRRACPLWVISGHHSGNRRRSALCHKQTSHHRTVKGLPPFKRPAIRRPDKPNTSPAQPGAGGADHGRHHTGPADRVRRVAHDIGWQ